MKVLVLGASGFFGSWICRELEAGFEVTHASRQEGDLLDPAAMRRLIGTVRPATVINAAGMTSPAAAREDPAGCFAVNAGGVLNLLESIRQEAPEARLIALSSAAVYAGEPPFDEGSATGAGTPYAASKLAMELLCGQYIRDPGLAVTVLRCFNLTGPGEPVSQATSEFALAAISAGPGGTAEIEVGSPEVSRDFTDVRDAARAVAAVAGSETEGTFNLCSGQETSLADLASLIGEKKGVRLVLRGSASGLPRSGQLGIRGNPEKLRLATGWEPEIDLRQSLSDLVDSREPEPTA